MSWARVGVSSPFPMLTLEGEAPYASYQEKWFIRPRHFSRDHWRRQEDSSSSEKTNDICPRGRGECGLLCAKRQGAAHGCFQDRQRSNHRDRQPGKLLW